MNNVPAGDLLIVQGMPGTVRAPVKPAPPWSAAPFAPHGRVSKPSAPVRLLFPPASIYRWYRLR